MANSSNKYLGRPSYSSLSKPTDISNMKHTPSDSAVEFDEHELYSSVVVELDVTRVPGCGMPNKPCSSKRAVGLSDPSSLPVNIPDWSKILGKQHRQNRGRDEVEEQVQDGDVMVPPHEFLANTRMASMSVQEGIGRTLKGRDLRRVRNSVWDQTGFQD